MSEAILQVLYQKLLFFFNNNDFIMYVQVEIMFSTIAIHIECNKKQVIALTAYFWRYMITI